MVQQTHLGGIPKPEALREFPIDLSLLQNFPRGARLFGGNHPPEIRSGLLVQVEKLTALIGLLVGNPDLRRVSVFRSSLQQYGQIPEKLLVQPASQT
jgi:hypothetical protein